MVFDMKYNLIHSLNTDKVLEIKFPRGTIFCYSRRNQTAAIVATSVSGKFSDTLVMLKPQINIKKVLNGAMVY